MRQIAVLPYRTVGPAVDAPIQILLITSRQTKRWVIPKGGRMVGAWPGLANEALEEGADLAVVTDYRAVLAELLSGHMGLADPGRVFPGLATSALGLWG